jgi:hypothetical protein
MKQTEKVDSLKIDSLNTHIRNALNLANDSKGRLKSMSFSETLREALEIIRLSNPDLEKVYANKTANNQKTIQS